MPERDALPSLFHARSRFLLNWPDGAPVEGWSERCLDPTVRQLSRYVLHLESLTNATQAWLVETGNYEERYVFGVYVSVDAAIAGIKAGHPAPYIVKWHDLEHGEDYSTLTGDFEAVQNYSTKHQSQFDIRPMEVQA